MAFWQPEDFARFVFVVERGRAGCEAHVVGGKHHVLRAATSIERSTKERKRRANLAELRHENNGDHERRARDMRREATTFRHLRPHLWVRDRYQTNWLGVLRAARHPTGLEDSVHCVLGQRR